VARIDRRSYDRRVMIAMAVYVAIFLTVWPLARSTSELPLKVFYATTPVLPLLYVIWLMAQRILRSDELEQRTHLIGLGIATVVVAVVSIIAGFLAAANVMTLDSTSIVLVWIFPLLMVAYSLGRNYAARSYGISTLCEDEDRMPAYVRFLCAAAIISFVAAYVYLRTGDTQIASILVGMASAMTASAIFFGIRRWRRRRSQAE
jgi:hypothetical protein